MPNVSMPSIFNVDMRQESAGCKQPNTQKATRAPAKSSAQGRRLKNAARTKSPIPAAQGLKRMPRLKNT